MMNRFSLCAFKEKTKHLSMSNSFSLLKITHINLIIFIPCASLAFLSPYLGSVMLSELCAI